MFADLDSQDGCRPCQGRDAILQCALGTGDFLDRGANYRTLAIVLCSC
jgi:hypothetical protein